MLPAGATVPAAGGMPRPTAQAMLEMVSRLDDSSLSTIVASVLQQRPDLAPGVVSIAVPDLTYAPSKGLTERRCNGVIKKINQQLGYGFIACPELSAVFGCDVFLHKKQVGSFVEGQRVSFAVTLNKENKPQAFDLMDSSQPAPTAGACAGAAMGAVAAMPGMPGMQGMPGTAGTAGAPAQMGMPGVMGNAMGAMMAMGMGSQAGSPAGMYGAGVAPGAGCMRPAMG
mmetsp:Transcript_77604/g.231217  ORF Transcript_77604/g.231217 Transcript_77604/m.231217 type:complete len:227 (-) Transcript_77604:62-742(-)